VRCHDDDDENAKKGREKRWGGEEDKGQVRERALASIGEWPLHIAAINL
jgi:hypothetical protein